MVQADQLDIDRWIAICRECIQDCENVANTCMDMGLVGSMQRCIQLCWDCADACTMATRFIANGSPLAAQVWQACADACRACAVECARYNYDFCKQAAGSCHKCLDLSALMIG